ncbi:MAG TPA: AMP-binding protein [Geminicoccaceae bacterium]|nr:AMP-binding protein [Geminicoccus sp.]HMU49970.1 AMP-binding protein [Geminicoccaceae bacterium]
MPNASFFSLLQSRFPSDGTKPAIVTAEGRSIGYDELDDWSARYGRALLAQGARPGDRVAYQIEKSPEGLFLYLGALRAGLVALPMNPGYLAGEVRYMLGNATPEVFVGDPARIEELRPDVPRVLTLDRDGKGSLADIAQGESVDLEPAAMRRDEIAAMLYTSGTTGRPKGAPLSHGNLASNAHVLAEAWGFGDGDVLLHALPMFHAHGLFVAAHVSLLSGATMLWLNRFDAGRVVELLPRATVMMGVPTFYTRLLDDPGFDRTACRNIRLFVSGSAPLLAETWRGFEQRTGHAILERYGMSEILMHTGNPLHGERRPGSVGLPFPGSAVRIVDSEDRELPPGEIGAVLVKGPNVFSGYWKMPEKNREEFTADGWFRTGDLGSLGEDGYLTLAGRAKDLVITGGLNVYPPEVEAVIDAMPGVVESAVVALPHRDLGEAVTAVVKATTGGPDEARVIAHCKARLAGFKVPKRVVVVDDLPRNAMGKVQKKLLREQYARLYDGSR